jgi:hypothetical protein
MRHATETDLLMVDRLLDDLRKIEGMTEKKTGIFYRKSRSFLHFHEDKGKLFADVRQGDDFDRLPASTRTDQKKLLIAVKQVLAQPARRPEPC